MRKKINWVYPLSVLVSVVLALIVCAVILLATGFNPLRAYGDIFSGCFRNLRSVGDMLEYAMVLCLCGLACVLGSRVGIFNVGGEGQLLLGAIFSCQIAIWLNGSPRIVVMLLAALGAIVVGGLYALLPGVLKVKLKVNEVIITIMLNTVAACLCSYLANGPWTYVGKLPGMSGSTNIMDTTYKFSKIIPRSNMTTAFIFAVVMSFLVWLIMQRTSKGFEMKLTGQNSRFARFIGLKTDRIVIVCMVISGMMCGLVGMFRVFGTTGAYSASISNDYYFEGLMVAMIAQYQPLPVILLSLFFAMLKIGANALQTGVGAPPQIYMIIQTVIIFFMAAQGGVLTAIKNSRAKKAARAAAEERLKGGEQNG